MLDLDPENLLDEDWVKAERFLIDSKVVKNTLKVESFCEIKIFWKGNIRREKLFIKDCGTWGDSTSITYTDEGFPHYLVVHLYEIDFLEVKRSKYIIPEIICFRDTWYDKFTDYLETIVKSTIEMTPRRFLALGARFKEASSIEQKEQRKVDSYIIWKLLEKIKTAPLLGNTIREYEFELIQSCCDDSPME